MSNKQLLQGSFDPKAIEADLYAEWEQNGYFDPSGEGKSFCIAIPPPNVTGTLHVGHAFQQTLMDAIIRYRRMAGFDTLWQTGTDHAGISTQMVVTEQIRAEGQSPAELGRKKFVDRVWEWKNESGGTITRQMRRMGASVDWSRERFTMDEGFSRAVTEVFVRLYEDGLIYKGTRLVNWDPELKTALSDLEVVSESEDGHLWHIKYPFAGNVRTSAGDSYLVVATTRPETMLGDTAVAVNPNDERYKSVLGKSVDLPLTDRKIQIIADEHVDMEFGTGCLKITPAHDFDDNDIGLRHGLDQVNIFTTSATLNENSPRPYQGMDRFDGRRAIVRDLEDSGLLDSVEPYSVKIPRGERSNAIVEPLLTNQWFVDVKPLAEKAVQVVREGLIEFVPKHWENLYFAWMREVRDWCISRQQWWGHQIPAWYDSEQNIYVGRTEDEARKKANLSPDIVLERDSDVLETWFSSSLWTFGTLGWPEDTREFRTYHPTDVLVTGHDIIFFWVARMIMMTLRFTNEVPFKKVYITGLIRDAEGKKMSKTAGNGLDPLDLVDGIGIEGLIEKRTRDLTQPRMAQRIERATRRDFPKGIKPYGADALRFTLCAIASPTDNYNLDVNRIEGYHFFCNKIWHATKFVLANCKGFDRSNPKKLSMADRWIRSRMRTLIEDCIRAFETYRFDLCAKHMYDFVWHEYCDWYLELTKPLIYDDLASSDLKNGARYTLLEVLELTLRTMHPIMPFITETLWKQVAALNGRRSPSLMLEHYPTTEDLPSDPQAESNIDWLKKVVTAIRNIRGERQISPKRNVPVEMSEGSTQDRHLSEYNEALLCKLAHVSELTWTNGANKDRTGSVQLVNGLKITVPFVDADEISSERNRINKELTRIDKELIGVEAKLNNENFVQKAPPNIVEAQRDKAETLRSQRITLEDQASQLPT
ncbi:MAG: valine--tRNA ligase [Gammaproteobacteria bacterium]|nr:valine--tRNA ligase [Gammaproteobacteria bacterium]